MPAWVETLIGAMRTEIGTVWPEVKPNGIWEAEHVDSVPWAHLTTPMAVIVLSDMVLSQEWGLVNQAYEQQAEVYYVTDATGDSSALIGKLEALRDRLLTNGLTQGMVLDVNGLNWSDDLPPNQILMGKNYPQAAGVLRAQVLWVETP